MSNQNLFHKAAGATTAVLSNWIEQENKADDILEVVESIVMDYAEKNNVAFKQAKQLFPAYKKAYDDYKFWNQKVREMKQSRKEALLIW